MGHERGCWQRCFIGLLLHLVVACPRSGSPTLRILFRHSLQLTRSFFSFLWTSAPLRINSQFQRVLCSSELPLRIIYSRGCIVVFHSALVTHTRSLLTSKELREVLVDKPPPFLFPRKFSNFPHERRLRSKKRRKIRRKLSEALINNPVYRASFLLFSHETTPLLAFPLSLFASKLRRRFRARHNKSSSETPE